MHLARDAARRLSGGPSLQGVSGDRLPPGSSGFSRVFRVFPALPGVSPQAAARACPGPGRAIPGRVRAGVSWSAGGTGRSAGPAGQARARFPFVGNSSRILPAGGRSSAPSPFRQRRRKPLSDTPPPQTWAPPDCSRRQGRRRRQPAPQLRPGPSPTLSQAPVIPAFRAASYRPGGAFPARHPPTARASRVSRSPDPRCLMTAPRAALRA